MSQVDEITSLLAILHDGESDVQVSGHVHMMLVCVLLFVVRLIYETAIM